MWSTITDRDGVVVQLFEWSTTAAPIPVPIYDILLGEVPDHWLEAILLRSDAVCLDPYLMWVVFVVLQTSGSLTICILCIPLSFGNPGAFFAMGLSPTETSGLSVKVLQRLYFNRISYTVSRPCVHITIP